MFEDEDDYQSFLEGICRAKELYPFRIHSMCLMTNHVHLLIETGDVELWKIMQRILHPYAMNYNRKYHFSGHLFEGRYKACLIEDDSYFLEVSRYIHLNPVKAGMVGKPADYEYSSFGIYTGGLQPVGRTTKSSKMIAELVDTSRVFSYFPKNAGYLYRAFVNEMVSHSEQEQRIRKEMDEDELWLPIVEAEIPKAV